MIYIIDLDGKVQGVLSNELPSSIPFWEDMYVENIEDALSTYEFKCPADGTESIKGENYVAIQDLDGQLVLFKIRETPKYHDTDGKLYKQVYAENAALELLKTIVRPRSYSGATADQVLNDILQGTLWHAGTVEVTDVKNIEFTDYITATEAIQNIKDTYGGEIRYRVELSGGQISKRYIDIVQQRGQYTGKRFTYSKDIKSITRTEDTSELYTAIIGLGKADDNGVVPTITNETGTFTNKNGTVVTKYAGQDYIGDPDALARWSDDGQHLMGVLKTEETVPFVILQRAWDYLQQHVEPKLTYEVEVALLEQISGYEHEKVRIGDVIVVEDLSYEPSLVLEARIIEMGISKSDPSQNYVKLSNFVELEIQVEQQVKDLLNLIKQKENAWDSAKTVANTAQETAQQAQETATDAQNLANTAQTTAESAQTTATNAENTANEAQNTANTALDTANTAQETANNAQTTANNAMTAANGKNTVYRQPTQPTGTFVTGDLWFDTANGNRISVWDGTQWVPSQFGSMAISNLDAGVITTGTLDADKVTVKNLEADSIKSLNGLNVNNQFIVDANGNVTFKGNLAGATGTFSGNISTSADANVGNNINLGNVTDYSQKKITFNDLASISSNGSLLSVNGPGIVTITNNSGAYVEMDGNTVSIGGILSVDEYLYVDPNNLRTNMTETSNCGVAGWNPGTSGVFAGTWQPFKVTKTYTPTTVNLTTGDHNLTSLAGVKATAATVNGFWLYLTGQQATPAYKYWRGTYNA